MRNQADTPSDCREFWKIASTGAAAVSMLSTSGIALAQTPKKNARLSNGADNFDTSDKAIVRTVGVKNQYRMTVAGNLFNTHPVEVSAS